MVILGEVQGAMGTMGKSRVIMVSKVLEEETFKL